MFYSGDEFADDEITSGPYDPERDGPLTDEFADDGWDHDTQERRT